MSRFTKKLSSYLNSKKDRIRTIRRDIKVVNKNVRWDLLIY